MWTKEFASKMGRLVVRGLVRWLEMLGENPPLSRDHGFLVWQALHQGQDAAGDLGQTVTEGGARSGAPRPASIGPGALGGLAGPAGWIPPLGSIESKGGPAPRAIN